LVGIREYATNSTDTDSVTRSSMKRTSFHACRREVGIDGSGCVIVPHSPAFTGAAPNTPHRPVHGEVDPPCGHLAVVDKQSYGDALAEAAPVVVELEPD